MKSLITRRNLWGTFIKQIWQIETYTHLRLKVCLSTIHVLELWEEERKMKRTLHSKSRLWFLSKTVTDSPTDCWWSMEDFLTLNITQRSEEIYNIWKSKISRRRAYLLSPGCYIIKLHHLFAKFFEAVCQVLFIGRILNSLQGFLYLPHT